MVMLPLNMLMLKPGRKLVTLMSNDDRGEDSLDQFYFLKLPHHPFHFEV